VEVEVIESEEDDVNGGFEWEEVEIGIGRVVVPPLRFSVVKWPEWFLPTNEI